MSADTVKSVLLAMAYDIEQRGDLGPYRAWDDHKRKLDGDEFALVRSLVASAPDVSLAPMVGGVGDNSALVDHFRREGWAM